MADQGQKIAKLKELVVKMVQKYRMFQKKSNSETQAQDGNRHVKKN